MKKTTIHFAAILLIFTISSCKKEWFNEKSDRNLSVPTTLQDFEYIMNNYEAFVLVSPAMGEIASDGHYIPESRWQTLSQTSANILVQKNAYTWTNTYLNENIKDWNLNYSKIFQCNLILNGLNAINPSFENERYNQVKGGALFHRAKCYYDLAQIYGQPYKKETAAQDIGIPLKTGIDITEKSQRSTVKNTYLTIITDLIQALNLLPVRAQYLTNASKLSCFGLLARTHLVMGEYEKAGAYADSVLKSYSVLLNYNNIPLSNVNMGLFNEEVIFHSLMMNYQFVYSSGYIFIDPELYNLYHDDDLRKKLYFNIRPNGIVFKGMYNNGILQFSGLATDEMYLIRAECYARQGKLSEAMEDLNDLLRTRWAKDESGNSKYIDQTAANELQALNIIITERRKELLLRGLRWSDLRRLNMEDRFKTILSRTIDGQTYILDPNSYKYTFPIPDDEISLSGIQQNPGWER